MGHDITAINNSDQTALRAEYRVDDYDDGWLKRYERFKALTEVAYLRRSAFDDFNRVIYEALQAMEHYGGCSGLGGCARFDLAQIEAAIARVELAASGPSPTREPNMADDVLRELCKAFSGQGDRVEPGGSLDSVGPELEFLCACRAYLRETGAANVEIGFG